MAVVDAPGPAEFIEGVIPLLQKKSELLVVTVNTKAEAAYKVLKKYQPLRCNREEDAEKIFKDFNPDMLAVATSSLVLGPYVNNKFTTLAHEAGKKIICFQDYWANHRWHMNYTMMPHWQKILVPDELARKFIMEDGFVGEIVITGNPGFDKFIKFNKEKDRRWLREKFGLSEHDFVMLYVGRGTPQTFEYDEITFKFFAESVREAMKMEKNKKIYVAIRPHPRDENPERYDKYSDGLNLLDTSLFPSSSDLLPIFDFVTGMQSTNHIEACYLQIPTACFILPNAGKLALEKISLSDFPPNLVGASIGIYSSDTEKFKDIILKVINDKHFISEITAAQKTYFPLPKIPAAKKVADEILKF